MPTQLQSFGESVCSRRTRRARSESVFASSKNVQSVEKFP